MAKLSSYMSEAGDAHFRTKLTEKAKHHVIDTFAAMISGSDLPPARAAINYARDFNTDKTTTIVCIEDDFQPAGGNLRQWHVGALGRDRRLQRVLAITLLHCAVVPATLAAGGRSGIDGTRFLRAVTLGYDIGPRTDHRL